MNCNQVRAALAALRDGELKPFAAAPIHAHLAGCSDCTRARSEFAAVADLANAWEVSGGDVWHAVSGQIRPAVPEVVAPTSGATDRPPRKRFDDVLIRNSRLTGEQLAQARERQKSASLELDRVLIELGFVSQKEVTQARAEAENLPFIDLTRHPPERSATQLVPEYLAKKHNVLPVKKDGQRLWVALADPKNIIALDDIRMASRCSQVQPMLAAPDDLENAIAHAYGLGKANTSNKADSLAALLDGMTPAALVADGDRMVLLAELQQTRSELQALRGELQALRGEVRELRQPGTGAQLPQYE